MGIGTPCPQCKQIIPPGAPPHGAGCGDWIAADPDEHLTRRIRENAVYAHDYDVEVPPDAQLSLVYRHCGLAVSVRHIGPRMSFSVRDYDTAVDGLREFAARLEAESRRWRVANIVDAATSPQIPRPANNSGTSKRGCPGPLPSPGR